MNMFIVCDESKQGNSSVIGGISISVKQALEFEKECFKKRYNEMVFGEISWKCNNSRGKYQDFYLDLIRLFFSFSSARFHSNSYTGNQYKVGYALIKSISWKLAKIGIFSPLDILFDGTGELGKKEIEITRKKLTDAYTKTDPQHKVYHEIRMCNQTDSNVINLCQIADLLTGAVAYKIALKEGSIPNVEARDYFIQEIEKMDGNMDISFSIPHKLWKYNEKRIQHYNLHLLI